MKYCISYLCLSFRSPKGMHFILVIKRKCLLQSVQEMSLKWVLDSDLNWGFHINEEGEPSGDMKIWHPLRRPEKQWAALALMLNPLCVSTPFWEKNWSHSYKMLQVLSLWARRGEEGTRRGATLGRQRIAERFVLRGSHQPARRLLRLLP